MKSKQTYLLSFQDVSGIEHDFVRFGVHRCRANEIKIANYARQYILADCGCWAADVKIETVALYVTDANGNDSATPVWVKSYSELLEG